MSADQISILAILSATVAVFIWGKWRHDIVAVACLLACVFAGIVPAVGAFAGFGHPAVITVACVLILSWGLQATGVVDSLTNKVLPARSGPTLTIAAITALGALLSAFMNNVGAMALLMPVAIQIARRLQLSPGQVLMPLSFGTILGGMTTLIGTPPNLIVSGFRNEAGRGSFGMFDFTEVGLAVAGGGVLFIALAGWRLVPVREKKGEAGFDTGVYFTEVRVTEKSKSVGKPLSEIETALEKGDAQIIALIRNDLRLSVPNLQRTVRVGDILVIEAEPESLSAILSNLGLVLEEYIAPAEASPAAKKSEAGNGDASSAEHQNMAARAPSAHPPGMSRDGMSELEDEGASDGAGAEDSGDGEDTVLNELVVMPNSLLIGRSARDVRLRSRFNMNLLAISRQGNRSIKRLRATAFAAGDVLLIQGPAGSVPGFASEFGCVPLAARTIRIPDKQKALMATGVMLLAVGGAAFGLMPAAISFASGVLVFMLLRVMPLRKVYEAVDWPVVVLLGALIPVAKAMESTGAADLMANALLATVAQNQPIVALALILILTMTLSDFMNNAATAAVMCPVAISAAGHLGANPDTFLMAVAIGASCAFLTPIGHQNNTLILGPGGFRFSDYWQMGLPMEILVIGIALPVLLIAWPL